MFRFVTGRAGTIEKTLSTTCCRYFRKRSCSYIGTVNIFSPGGAVYIYINIQIHEQNTFDYRARACVVSRKLVR